MDTAIVIKETATKIFIVPCSSGSPRKDKNGNIYPEFEVATVNDGVVTGVSAGTATITASCGGYSDTCTVTVSAGE